MDHKLKVRREPLENMFNGTKHAEIRFNDRDYQVGDVCFLFSLDKLNRNNPQIFEDTKPDGSYIISHIHSGLGMAENYVILSFRKFIVNY